MTNTVFILLLSLLNVSLGSFLPSNCEWLGSSYGVELECLPGYFVQGICGSGANPDCGSRSSSNAYFYQIQCCPTTYNFATQSDCTIFGSEQGEKLTCPIKNGIQTAAYGGCGSNHENKCKSDVDSDKHTVATECCINNDISINNERCSWRYGMYGEQISCPAGYIVTGQCGSTDTASCENNEHTGILCCPFTDITGTTTTATTTSPPVVPFDPEWDYSLIKTITDEFKYIGWQQKIDDEFLYVPGGDKKANTGDGCVKRFELAHHNLNMTYMDWYESHHGTWYRGVAVGDDVVLATDYSSGIILLFNKNGSLLQEISLSYPYQIATDGDQVFVSTYYHEPQQFYSLTESHTAMEPSVSFSDISSGTGVTYDSKYIYIGGEDSNNHYDIFVIDRSSYQIVEQMKDVDLTRQLKKYSDYLIQCSVDGSIRIYDTNSWKLLNTINLSTTECDALDAQGGYIFTYADDSYEIKIYDIGKAIKGQPDMLVKTIPNNDFDRNCYGINYHAGLKQLYLSCLHGDIFIYEFDST